MAVAAPEKPVNVHATALVVAETGVLIVGRSGSGKSRTARDLIRSANGSGRFACLVADDQVLLKTVAGRVIAMAPQATAGLIEMRGSAITRVPHLPRAVMHVVMDVGPADDRPRLTASQATYDLGNGIVLPLLQFCPGDRNHPMDLLAAFAENRLLD